MKFVLLVCTLFSGSVFANWTPVVSCENGGFVIDEHRYTCKYGTCQDNQLVIRSSRAIQEFLARGAIDRSVISGRGEMIIGGLLFDTSQPEAMVTLRRFSEDEVKKGGYAWVLGYIRRGPNDTYQLRAVKANPYPSERPIVADWVFRDCR